MSNPKNNCNLSGGMVTDPEVKTIGSGTKLVEFRFAVDRACRDATNSNNTTMYLDVTLFDDGTQPTKFVFDQVAAGNMKKGTQVMLCGQLRQEIFEGKDKVKQYRYKITADSITYQGGERSERTSSASASASQPETTGQVIDRF